MINKLKSWIVLISFLLAAFYANYAFCYVPALNVSDEAIDIEADKVYRHNNLIYAIGQVVITQSNQVIMADEVTYNQITREVYAVGNIALTREDGSVYFGDKVKLDKIQHKGIILNFKGRFGNQSTIAAKYANMIDENQIELSDMVYSPCTVCETNFSPNEALWQLRAKHAILNRTDERIVFDDVKVEAFGYPIFYTPYLSTPSPTAKSKTGFLIPQLRWSETFGTQIRVPYYLKLYPNMDATFGVGLYQRVGNVYDLEFRHAFPNGNYKFFSSITQTNKFNNNGTEVEGKKDLRGHYAFKGKYNIITNQINGLFTLDSKHILDHTKTYLKKYHFGEEDVLTTDAHFRSIDNNSYTSLRSLFFQDLRPNTSSKTTANALPQLTYIYSDDLKNYGVKADILIDYTNINRPQGMNYNRIVNIWSLGKNFLSTTGIFWKNQISARGDLYYIDFRQVTAKSNYMPKVATKSGTETRFHPEFITSLDMPLYNVAGRSLITIDPIIQAIISPNQANLKKVDNEDSQAPEISTSNLFSTDRYKGYDLLESGTRINYGVRSIIKAPYLNNLSIIAGQTYRFTKNSNFNRASGLDNHTSDYVAKISLTPDQHWNISNGIRLDQNNLTINRNEFGINYHDEKFSVNIFHFQVSKKLLDLSRQNDYKQEILFSTSYNFYNSWWAQGFVKAKLGKKQIDQSTRMISDGLSLKTTNECLSFEIGVQRDYTRLKDLKPTTNYVFKVNIPTF